MTISRPAAVRTTALVLLLLGLLSTGIGPAQAQPSGGQPPEAPRAELPSTQPPSTGPRRALVPDVASSEHIDITVEAGRLDRARNQISTSLGASTYEINRQAIDDQPLGNNAPINETLLQAPSVALDSFGQIHVRGEHANVQYRINGVIIPETISGFAQAFDTRFARRIDLITGALPAQYGYRTSGIVEIETKGGALEPGGSFSLYGGQRRTFFPSVEYGGSSGKFDYFVSGSYLQNNIGIENTTFTSNPIKDFTHQGKGFLYLSGIVDDTTRVSFISGSAASRFRLPNNPGQVPSFTAYGFTDFNSAGLRERQLEESQFNIVSVQKSAGDFNGQIAYFNRYSAIHYFPDPVGDLMFNGVASNVRRENFANGLQSDASYRLNEWHTLRGGVFADVERARSRNLSTVLPLDENGNAVDDPFSILDRNRKVGYLIGAYLQDEWRITDRFTLNFGARADRSIQYVDANQISPRANAVFKPFDGTTLHVGYARYFTPPPLELIAPTAVESFVGTTAAPGTLQDDKVKPERAHYFDAGIVQKITPEFQVGVDGYYKAIRNVLDEGQFGQALVFSPFNYEKGRIYGAEVTASWQATRELMLYGNFGWLRAQGKNIVSSQFNFDPDELAYIATHWVYLDHDQRVTISGGVQYRWSELLFTANLIYGSGLRRGFANTEKLDPYVRVNAGVSREFTVPSFGKFTARLDVINLFDRVYEIRDGSGIGVGAPQFGQRRTFLVGLSKKFGT